MALHTLQPETLLREYRIIKLLGEGGFGLTYLAFDTHLEKHVAIKEYMPAEHAIREPNSKIVPRSSSSEKTYNWGLNAFLNEAKTLAKFENPSIVRIYRFFKENGTAYIVMEYCEGGCLIDLVSKDKPMDEIKLKGIITSIVSGLQLVHKEGILHRDIKPDNIMFRANGSAVLIDFGAARQAIGGKARKVTTVITPGYAPLEQYSSKGKIGPWSDIYSLAAVAYLCITGKKPPDIMNRLHDDTLVKLSEGLNSSRFLYAIDCGLGLQVNQRPQSLSEWSSLWETSDKSKTRNQPIIAQKEISPKTHSFKSQAISARPNISTRERTTINTNTFEYNKTKKTGVFKWFLLIFTLLMTGFTGYVAYEYYVNKKEINTILSVEIIKTKWHSLFAASTEEQIKIKESIKDNRVFTVQKMLNELDYKVAQNGILDIRTQQSIKKFEADNQLVATGIIDDILIRELTKKVESLELNAWNQTLSTNTADAFKKFTSKYPDSKHNIDIDEKIKQINETKTLEQKLLGQQSLMNVAKEKRRLISEIQAQFIRLKYTDLNQTGNLDLQTRSLIKTYQNLKNLPLTGLPTKTLLFKLKSEKKWPGKRIGEVFKACKNCPQMVVIKAGNFIMGNKLGESTQKPERNVYIKEFSISQLPVSLRQWGACYANGFCTYKPDNQDDGKKDNPIINISYEDSLQFISWLQSLSGQNYQLPSESQWEFAAHSTIQGNSYQLKDSTHSITELTQDCWHPNYLGAPSDGSAWKNNNCPEIVIRKNINKRNSPTLGSRDKIERNQRKNTLGFRVVISPN